MNFIIAIAFLIACDIVADIPQGKHEIDNIHRRLNRIEQKLNIENIDVVMTGDVEELNDRIDEWNKTKSLPVYRTYDDYMNKRIRMNMNNNSKKVVNEETKRN